ncbi:MAG TPA: glycine oxidase ThiO, partial [Gemmataceae bacterium]|nr:glycine oxidase ThiO [Gemmataceae bacterium]
TTAYYLTNAGARVLVLDKGEFGQEASWAGAGILSPGNPERAKEPYDMLRAHSAALFPRLSAELADLTGIDNGYVRCGGLEFATPDEPNPEDHWRAEGIAFEKLDGQAAHELEPALADIAGVVYALPDMGQVRNPRHLKALIAACTRRGVTLHPGCPAYRFERHGGRISAVHTAQGNLMADKFLIATGAWTTPLIQPLGVQPGIHPVRGQIAFLNTRANRFSRVIQQGHRYLVPRLDGRVLVGSTEEEVGFDKRTTASAIADLLQFAIAIVPGLQDAAVERCWAGLRPGSPDGLPFLGRVPGCDNLFIAAGHFRTGIQLSPATALVMKECLLEQPLTIPLEPFRLDRPPGPRHRPAFRS